MHRRKSSTLTNPRDSVVSLCGVIAGQIAMFLCMYLLGHWHGPGTLGRFSYWLAIGSFISSILAFRYELACVNDRPADSFKAFINASLLAVVVGLTSVAVTYGLGHAEFYVVEIFSIASFTQMAASLYYSSLRWYAKIAVSRTAINALFVGYLLLDHFRADVDSSDPFAWYTCITAGVALVMVITVVRSGLKEGFSFQLSKRFYVDNRRLAIYVLPSSLCGAIASYALAIVIPRWYGAESAGYFAAAYRLGFFPVSLVGQSLGGVFLRDAIAAISKDNRGTGLRRVYATYARTLTLLAALYALGGALLFAPLVRLSFGSNWQETIEFFYRLIPLFTMQLIFLPLAPVFLAAKAQRTDFLVQLNCCVGLLATLYFTKLAGLSVLESVQAFSLSGTVLTGLGIVLTYRASHRNRVLSGAAAQPCRPRLPSG
jgi:O-antigen/teichoic acid export membrane protein